VRGKGSWHPRALIATCEGSKATRAEVNASSNKRQKKNLPIRDVEQERAKKEHLALQRHP